MVYKYKFETPFSSSRQFPELKITDEPTEVHLEFKSDFYLNSIGLVHWISWMKPLSKSKNIRIFLHHCSPMVIQQINIVATNLPKNMEVVSFYVPYYSEKTEETKTVFFESDSVFKNEKLVLPDITDSKGDKMEPDIKGPEFFNFLKMKS